MATVTFKSIKELILQVLPEDKFSLGLIYDSVNRSIRTLSSEGSLNDLMPETKETIAVSVAGVYALSGLTYQHLKTEKVIDPNGNECLRIGREAFKTGFTEDSDLRYAQESGSIYVDPDSEALDYEIVYRSFLPKFTSFGASGDGTTISINKYFIPAIKNLTIANLSQAKNYGIANKIPQTYQEKYLKNLDKLKAIAAGKKEEEL